MIASSGMVIVVVIVSSSVLFCAVVDSFHFRAVWILSTRRLIVVIVVVIIVITVIVSSFLLLSAVVDYFRFGAVWILSTGRLSVVRLICRCCGFFPLQSRVDSFHSATQCCPLCLAMLWILSTSEPCGFFAFDVIIVVVVMNITVSRSPPPVQLEGMHRRPRTAFTVAIAVAKARLFYRLFTLSSPRLAPPWQVSCQDRRKPPPSKRRSLECASSSWTSSVLWRY